MMKKCISFEDFDKKAKRLNKYLTDNKDLFYQYGIRKQIRLECKRCENTFRKNLKQGHFAFENCLNNIVVLDNNLHEHNFEYNFKCPRCECQRLNVLTKYIKLKMKVR